MPECGGKLPHYDPISVVGKTYMLAEKEILKARRCAVFRLGLPMCESIQGKKGAIDLIEGRDSNAVFPWRSSMTNTKVASRAKILPMQ
jgi:hypothetical protein